MKLSRIIPSLFFLFCFFSFSYAQDQIFDQTNIDDPAAWSALNNSDGSLGIMTGNLVFGSSKAITADNITILSNNQKRGILTAGGAHRFFTVTGGKTLNLHHILLRGGTYDGLDTEGGGAVSTTGTGLTIDGDFAIERSSSSVFGGAVYVKGGTAVINGKASFSLNSAVSGSGGAIYSGGGVVVGQGSHLVLDSNGAGLNGGGIYSNSGSVTIGGSAVISTNTAKTGSGGGIYASSGVFFNDAGSSIVISSNTSMYLGGGVYSGEDIIFRGGADISGNVASIDASSSTFHAGGGLYALRSVTFSSAGATIKLHKNSARDAGGAIYSGYGVMFSGSADITENRVHSSSGGAIWTGGNIRFGNYEGTVNISSNVSQGGSGGALYSENKIFFEGYVTAKGNAALEGGSGGAFYSRTLSIRDGAEISGNTADGKGGAVYIHHGESVFNALTRDILFTNNTASGTKNDVNLGGNARLILNADKGKIIFDGGLSYTSGSVNNIVEKRGGGGLYLNGISSFQTLNILSGTTVIGAGSSFEAIDFTLVGSNTPIGTGLTTVLDMRNGSVKDNLVISDVFSSTTGAKIHYDIDSNTNASDKISANTAYVDGTWIKVGIAGVEPYEKKYNIFQSADGHGALRIDNTNAEGRQMHRVKSHLLYYDGVNSSTNALDKWTSIDLVLSIDQLNAINGLTGNQKQVALALDKEYGTALGDLFEIIDVLDVISGNAGKKKALTSLSGHMLANAVTVAGLNVAKDSVISRLKRSYFIPDDSLIKRNIWAQGYGAGNKYKGDDNSPGDFSADNSGVQAGFDTMKDDKQIFGLSIGYVDTDARQNSDNVGIKGYNVGGYGAFFFENNMDLKLMLIGARQNYSSSRKIAYEGIEPGTGHKRIVSRRASGEFEGYSLNAAAELGYDYYYKNNIYFRPLLGLDYSYVATDEFTEKGADSANLTVYAGSYNRINAGFGFQLNNGADLRTKWYAEAKLNFLLSGRYGEFEGEFKKNSQPLAVKGIENDMFSAGIGAGVLYDISKSWSAYANINGLFSASQTGLYGNIGVNYKFTTTYFDFYER